MAENFDWGLIDDLFAVKKGEELPNAVMASERRRRALSMITRIMELASMLHITTADLARQAGISRPHFYHWLHKKGTPNMKSYLQLVRLCVRLHTEAEEQMRFYR